MMEFSGGLTYGFYGQISVLSAIFVWEFVPKTKGKTLENMREYLEKNCLIDSFSGFLLNNEKECPDE
ncbi:hypothetical protein [Cytobacillus firmus]|uniref:hypothetical protein n=1 Tax=Cytobacillus firmus TaxID=1399 RepID=UPI0039B6F2C5